MGPDKRTKTNEIRRRALLAGGVKKRSKSDKGAEFRKKEKSALDQEEDEEIMELQEKHSTNEEDLKIGEGEIRQKKKEK